MFRFPAVFAISLVGCVATAPLEIEPDFASAKADGLATRLVLVDDHRMDIDEPSDLVFARGALYAVSDRHARIYKLDRDGDVRGALDVLGVEDTDLEALAFDAHGRFYVGDESRATVWQLDERGQRTASFEIDTTDGNSGIEGLTFDDAGNMLVAKEKNPATIITLDAAGSEQSRTKLDFANDVSALAWNADDGHLYVLSADEAKLWRLDRHFDRITSWRIPVDAAEGLAFDGSTVYIASDSKERLYVFQLD